MRIISSIKPYVIVFSASACGLVLEIVAGRILAPTIGVSLYTNEEFLDAINFDWVDTIQIPFNLLDNFSIKGKLIMKSF